MPPHREQKSALEKMENAIYDPNKKQESTTFHDIRAHQQQPDVPTSWGEETPVLEKKEISTGLSFGAKFFIVSAILLVCALLFTAWRVMSLRNVVSSANIDMVIETSPYAEGGEALPVILSFTNRNTIDLKDVVLTFSYEKGVGQEDEQQKVSIRREIGNVAYNENKRETFDVVLYGEESTTRDLIAKLEYKVQGANALFNKVVTQTVVLKSPAVSLVLDGPVSLTPGQIGTYTITARNNTSTTSVPFTVSFLTPTTFTGVSSFPKTKFSRSYVWDVAALLPGESKDFVVRGSFAGGQGEGVTLRAIISASDNENAVVYAQVVKDVKLRLSPLTLTISASSDGTEAASFRFGDAPNIVVSYENTSSSALRNVEIEAAFSGDAAVYSGISPDLGYYNSISKTVLWNKTTFEPFASIPPGAKGTLRVYVPIVPSGAANPTLTLNVNGTADMATTLDVETSQSRTWTIQGTASLNGWTSYKESPFPNQGPLPPQANVATSYTLHLVTSSQNTLTGAKISFILPVYVTWQNVYTEGAQVTYNASSRTVTWTLGTVPPNTQKALDIQVSVRPSQSHIGTSPAITSGITLEATEESTRARIRTTLTPLTTSVEREPNSFENSRVVSQ